MTKIVDIKPEWEKLTPYQQIRLRTEMYFGSRDPHTQSVLEYDKNGPVIKETTWIPALFVAFREILDNSLDEIVTHKNGNRIDVTYDPNTMIFSVTDNGRGVPIEWNEKHEKYAATILLSELFAGRNFIADRGQTRGLNGVGSAGVVNTSEWFQVVVNRNNTEFEQIFREGEELIIEDPIIFPDNCKKTGTKILFKPSNKVFHQLILPESFIESRIHELALCYPNLHITYNGKRIFVKNQTTALFGDRKPIIFEIDEPGFSGRFWLIPQFLEEGEFSFSLVNGIPLFNGGTHLDAFRKSFYSGLITALEKESKKRNLKPNKADVSDELLIYNIMEMDSPSFDSQAKTRLINENVGKIVQKTLDDPEFFKDIIKKNPEWIDSIYEKCRIRTSAKDGIEATRDAKRNLRQKIEDLEDAYGTDRSKCILFLAEGKSACGGMVQAGNKEIHGCLPLTGKILNVFGESMKDIIANEAISKVMNSIQLIPGERVNRRNLRYGKIYISTDADEDGKHIASLLINFFYTLWPDLFSSDQQPFIYIFNTPLIIAAKGKKKEYWYSSNYGDFNSEKYKGWEITRAKGLAQLKRDDWKYILENPNVIPITDDGNLKKTLSLLFDDKKADDRKEWIGL